MGCMAAINDDVSVRQRLHTVEQRECGQARREQDEIGAAERRCAAPDVGGRILRCYQRAITSIHNTVLRRSTFASA